ncbi:APC family permease [Labedaea rhizosphaerae]|uniref:Amino acid/polyamine/organocation transporter (APC superfamily) n=1 Tax=Labedaea rhizosphaerae TaxID=598644 RepID=A0A4R6S2D2_LABRH|nr:amino acid permease [Labedaea rhizosphaerae]TDP93720.1 amino acid/polyamine/organocation transporter (APC superfamily) [Labedaea rhizosphaerae]
MPGNGLWRTKSVEQSIKDTDEPGSKLRRSLSTWDLTVFGVAVVIGAGIFTLTARTAGDYTGPSVAVSFIIAAIACALAAMCYAEFASTVPVAGSAYTFSYATFGEFVAWIIGWDLILELAVGAAAVARNWSIYLNTVLAYLFDFDEGAKTVTAFKIGAITIDWGALVVIGGLTTLLVLGTKLSSRVSMVITIIKVAIVLFVIFAGLFFVKAANYSPFIPPSKAPAGGDAGVNQSLFAAIAGSEGSNFGIFGLLAGASLVFFAFIGFDIVATTAEETKNPQRSVPRGILFSLGIVTVLYVSVSLVVVGMVKYGDLATTTKPDGSQDKKTLATAFAANGAQWGEQIVSIGALIGLTTVVMVLMLGQIRVIFAMGRDGLFPRWLSKSSDRGTPARATWVVGGLIAIAATFFPADKLEEMTNVGTLFAFVLVSAGVIVLRKTRPDLTRSFKAPGVPWLPILAIIACAWLMLNLEVLTWIRFVIWLAVGVVIYFGYSRRNSRLGQRMADGGEVPTKV